MGAGRPSLYSLELAAAICERLAMGESLRAICSDDDMPAMSSVFLWLTKHKEFSEQYAHARAAQADALADDVLTIADDGRNDWMERHGKDDAGWVANGEHVQRSRLRVDARKWYAGKLAPKKYGDRVQAEVSGEGGGPIEIITGIRRNGD